nr:reverse transcriptase domain-containing protein [Tanacetum cinerariifolium]
MSRGSYLSQSQSVFSRLKHGEPSPSRRRCPMSTTIFTRLGEKEKNVLTRLGEREKGVSSRLCPENTSCRRHANARRDASAGRATRDPNHRKKEARNLVHNYVTCSSERQKEIKENGTRLIEQTAKSPLITRKDTSLKMKMLEGSKKSCPQLEHSKTAKKWETTDKENVSAIFMVQPWQRVMRQKVTQSFSTNQEISFQSLASDDRQKSPMVIEAKIGGYPIHHMYVDRGSASEVLSSSHPDFWVRTEQPTKGSGLIIRMDGERPKANSSPCPLESRPDHVPGLMLDRVLGLKPNRVRKDHVLFAATGRIPTRDTRDLTKQSKEYCIRNQKENINAPNMDNKQ